MNQAAWQNFLFFKRNFEIIWFCEPFWDFCSPECIEIGRLFCVQKWPVFQVKNFDLESEIVTFYTFYIKAEN